MLTGKRIVLLLGGAVLFGLLMAVREAAAGLLVRALIAGLAFAVMALATVCAIRLHDK